MRRYLCLFLVFSMTLTLLSPALADHSIMPGDGLMDETAAVDAAVAFLCQRLGCGEEEIRGKYYYRTLFYESGWTFKGPVWSMTVIDPTVNEDGETLVSYNYEINASTGDVLDEGKRDFGWFVWELKDTPVIPRKDQLQPAEAIDRARAMIREVLGLSDEEMKDHWRDYVLDGWNENGGYRYRVTMCDLNLWEYTWEAVLNVETGSVVWHTDPQRFAARRAIEESGGYENWYLEQREAYIAEWGDPDTWDYEKWAAFEEHCFGSPLYPEAHCGLPGEEDCGPEEALDAVGRYLDGYAGPGMDTDAWTVRGSKFLLDHINENDPYPMPGYIAGTHVWELLVYFEMTGELALITVDAASAEVIGDEPAEENGDWAF